MCDKCEQTTRPMPEKFTPDQMAWGPSTAKMQNEVAYRQNARDQLAKRIGELRSKADSLQMLLDSLPAKLPPAADDALYTLVMDARIVR